MSDEFYKYSHVIIEFPSGGGIGENDEIPVKHNLRYLCKVSRKVFRYMIRDWETDYLPKCPECLKLMEKIE